MDRPSGPECGGLPHSGVTSQARRGLLENEADYRVIAVFGRLEQAELARGLLESEGIPAALLDAQVASLGLGPAMGGVRLLVPAWDAELAAALLAPPAVGTVEDHAPTPAPLPGGLEVVQAERRPDRWLTWVAVVIAALIGAALAARR